MIRMDLPGVGDGARVVTLVTILLTASIVTPIPAASIGTAGEQPVQSGQHSGTQESVTISVNTTEPAIQLKRKSLRHIDQLPNTTKEQQIHRNRAYKRINSTLGAYRGDIRVTSSSVFQNDSIGIQSLRTYAQTNAELTAAKAATLIAEADNQTASTSVADAHRGFTLLKNQLPNTGIRKSAEQQLTNAEEALERGQRDLRETNSYAETITARARASQQFKIAWRDAQQVLRTLDQYTEPRVTLTNRADPIRNGSSTQQRTITGAVFDARPWTIANVTVAVNGTVVKRQSNLTAAAVPAATNTSFDIPLRIEHRVATINVTAWDSADTRIAADRQTEGGDAGNQTLATQSQKSTSDAKQDSAEPAAQMSSDEAQSVPNQNSRATLRVDGDGLVDRYEISKTRTDPLNPDSDSTTTTPDEANNDIIDGNEDLDEDGLRNQLEAMFGTSPLNVDTDDDGVTDSLEVRVLDTRALDPDSDNDGIQDGEEDPDRDGVVNRVEESFGTDPHSQDSDTDGRDDRTEIDGITDPTAPDTDTDGLEDGDEFVVGTNATDPDTDDDGILDGNETYTTQTANQSLGVSVQLTGQGNVAGTTTIKKDASPRFDHPVAENLSAAPIVDLDAANQFGNATVSFEYNESRLGVNESELIGVRFNETAHRFEPLPTETDAANDTVSLKTEHFSTFTVFKIPNWRTMLEASEPTDTPDESDSTTKIDVMLIIDSSGSMGYNDPQEFRKQAAKEFVGALIDGDRAGVVDFDWSATVAQPLTEDLGDVNVTVENLDASGGTNIDRAITRANQHFAENSPDSRPQVGILLTDGAGYGGREAAQTASDRDTTIHTIGFGYANRNKLGDIAEITGGQSFYVDEAHELPDVFSRVAEDVGVSHSDEDGISDGRELQGAPVPIWEAPYLDEFTRDGMILYVPTDPTEEDTDGDGLWDNEEFEPVEHDISFPGVDETVTYLKVVGDPNDQNTDGAGYDDATEVKKGSSPKHAETVAAGYTLPVYSRTSTPPTQPTTVQALINSGEGWTRNPNYDGETDDHLVLIPERKTERNSGNVQVIDFTVVVAFNPNAAAEDHLERAGATATFSLRDRYPPRCLANCAGRNEILDGPETVTLEPGETRTLEYRIAVEPTAAYGFKNLINVKRFGFEVTHLDDTPFHRPSSDGSNGIFSKEVGYNYAGAPYLAATSSTLDRVNLILSSGLTIAGATTGGQAIVRTAQGTIELGMYEASGGELQQTFPTTDSPSPSGLLIQQGIGGFNQVIESRTQKENVETMFGGVVTYREN